MNLGILAVTDKGHETAKRLVAALPKAELIQMEHGVRHTLRSIWPHYDGIVCIMAAGIVVRCLSGLLRTKYHDPCVVVLDENGSHVISLLSGHIGGGNQLARQLARILGGTPVITTASDVSGHTSVDLWSVEQNLAIVNPELLANVSATLLNKGTLHYFQDREYIKQLPADFTSCQERESANIIVSTSITKEYNALQLIPRIRFIGCGCRRDTPEVEILEALSWLETQGGVELRSVAGIASIDVKKSEKGLLTAAARVGLPLFFFSKEELNEIHVPSRSETVYKKVGTYNVCEAAALKAAGSKDSNRLIMRKKKWKRITMAVAETAL